MKIHDAQIDQDRISRVTLLQGRIDGRRTTVSVAMRFWSHVKRTDGCWEWQGRRDEHGYGRTSLGGRLNRGAHRLAWELERGPVPPDLQVLHHCDNPPCCNPCHLFLGTNHDNAIDRHSKGRSKNLDHGELHPKAKLTSQQVNEMRALGAAGWTQLRLAERFGISRGNVSKIIRGRSY